MKKSWLVNQAGALTKAKLSPMLYETFVYQVEGWLTSRDELFQMDFEFKCRDIFKVFNSKFFRLLFKKCIYIYIYIYIFQEHLF